MKMKLILILLLAAAPLLYSGFTAAAEYKGTDFDYIGTSAHYAMEADIILKKSDYVDYNSRQLRLFLGSDLKNPWHLEWEIITGTVKEDNSNMKKDEMFFGVTGGLLYDFFKQKKYRLYLGISPGLAYMRNANGFLELADENPFFLIEGKLGINYKIGKNYFIRAQGGIWHMSSLFRSDQGHNCWDYSLHIGYRF